MKRRNTMTAAVFLLAVAAGFLLLATSFFGGEGKLEALLKTFLRERDVMAFVDGAESAINGDLDRDHLFIQLYGGVQRLSGRRVVEDAVGENTVVRLSTGGLNFVDLQAAPGVGPQVAENAAATAAFSQDLEALGIPYLYVNAPQKLQRGEALLPTGVEEYGNESADAFLAELERQGTDYVDLRPLFEENGIYSNWFFCTDHHWKPEAAFFAWQALTDELEERYGLAADPALTDPANWDTRVLEHFFLGSQGKRVGSLYAGADDITLYTPAPLRRRCAFPSGWPSRTGSTAIPIPTTPAATTPSPPSPTIKIRTGRGWCCCGTPLPAPSPPSWPSPARS